MEMLVVLIVFLSFLMQTSYSLSVFLPNIYISVQHPDSAYHILPTCQYIICSEHADYSVYYPETIYKTVQFSGKIPYNLCVNPDGNCYIFLPNLKI